MQHSNGKQILIVDDEPAIRRLFSRVLRSEGFYVLEAANAVDGYALVKNEDIDLILLDIKMPEVGGDDLFRVFSMFFNKAPVIVASVYAVEEQCRRIAGAADYFDKSQGVNILIAKVKSVLNIGLQGESLRRRG